MCGWMLICPILTDKQINVIIVCQQPPAVRAVVTSPLRKIVRQMHNAAKCKFS